MKLPPFDWTAPADLDECLTALAAGGDDTKIVAGGQSLLPLMALGLVSPTRLVDITRLKGLDGIQQVPGGVRLGALTVHRDLAADRSLAERVGVLRAAARSIGHLAIRNRGTIGGSLAHADRAAELPAAMLLLDATLECVSLARGLGRVPAKEFFLGPYTTCLAEDEMLTWIEIPIDPRARYGFAEFSVRDGDFAVSGACCAIVPGDNGELSGVRAVSFGAIPGPIDVAADAELPIGHGIAGIDWRALADQLASAIEGEVPRRLAAVTLYRALADASRQCLKSLGPEAGAGGAV